MWRPPRLPTYSMPGNAFGVHKLLHAEIRLATVCGESWQEDPNLRSLTMASRGHVVEK